MATLCRSNNDFVQIISVHGKDMARRQYATIPPPIFLHIEGVRRKVWNCSCFSFLRFQQSEIYNKEIEKRRWIEGLEGQSFGPAHWVRFKIWHFPPYIKNKFNSFSTLQVFIWLSWYPASRAASINLIVSSNDGWAFKFFPQWILGAQRSVIYQVQNVSRSYSIKRSSSVYETRSNDKKLMMASAVPALIIHIFG